MTPATALAGLAGIALVAIILWDALETILVPRRIGRRVRLTRYFYLVTWRLWRAWALSVRGPSRREGVLGAYGPLSLVGLLACWAVGLVGAFALLQAAANAAAGLPAGGAMHLVYMSGETFFTLGFGDVTPPTAIGRGLAVIEAGLGFGFLGTVVGYLPTMYAAFSAREVEISLMDARAGSPPTAAEFLRRTSAAGERGLCDEQLAGWERWAAQLLETHISYPQLAYYRSQHVNQSWLASLTAILDATALLLARDDGADAAQARLTFAMARHALVDVTQIFVPRWTPGAPERLDDAVLARLRASLAGGSNALPADAAFAERLGELRRMYEPYAQALASHLLFELPPWIADAPKRDNWQGGPWDRQIGARHSAEHAAEREEHF